MYIEDSEYDYILFELQRANDLLDKLAGRGYCFTSIQAKEDYMTSQITSGKVSVEDSKPHSNDEYGRRKVLVELSFACDDGAYEATFDLASEAASNRVAALLNGTNLRVVGTQARVNTLEPLDDGIVAPVVEKRKRRTAAEIAADAALAKAAHPKDPSAIDDEPGDGSPDPADLLPSEDDFNIEPEGEEPAEEITDAALNAAVQRKNIEIGDPEAIRGVIKLYNPDPTKAFQLREIPADKRADFITKLGGLTKASA